MEKKKEYCLTLTLACHSHNGFGIAGGACFSSEKEWIEHWETSGKHCIFTSSIFKKWCYPWVLKNVKRYEKPIPYKHPQGAVVWVSVEMENG